MTTVSINHSSHLNATPSAACSHNHIFKRKEQHSMISGKMQQFRVQIRNKQIGEYKNKIRQQIKKAQSLQELIQSIPFENEQSYNWASKMIEAYSSLETYRLTDDKVVDIFKMVQKFPNKLTLHLFEIMIVRADSSAIYNLFQYDVMRLLHGVINLTTSVDKLSRQQSQCEFEERQIIKEVVISNSSSEPKETVKSFNYLEKLDLARIVLRLIAQICKKNYQTRNFAVLNHKTYTYCLKLYKHFEKDVEFEFYMVLQALTYYIFEREGEQQFKRITNKIIQLFFEGTMDVKIEVVEQEQRSYLKAYQFLVAAVKNLLTMKSAWTNSKILSYKCNQAPAVLVKAYLILSQSNYVIDYPSLKEKESLIPIKLINEILLLIMLAFEGVESQPQFKRQYYHPIVYEIIHFLQNKQIVIHSSDFILMRRSGYFILSNFFEDSKDQNQIYNIIFCNNVQNSQENLISTLASLFEQQMDVQNRMQICFLLKSIFQVAPFHIIQPLVFQTRILQLLMDKVIEKQLWSEQYMSSELNAISLHIFEAVGTFFSNPNNQAAEKINQIRHIILSEYEEKLNILIHNSQMGSQFSHYASRFVEVVRWCLQ